VNRTYPKSALILTGLIALAGLWALFQAGPLRGSTPALIVTVLAQVYLPGYLLARRLGHHRQPHPILRFAWVLLCGLSLTIVLGGAARLLNIGVPVYLLALHGVMLALAWLPAGQPADAPPWRWNWGRLPLYLMIAAGCAAIFGASQTASRYRFYGFEDQVIFVSHISWLANNPGETPFDAPLRSRQVGTVYTRDTRFDTDGWTYTHAAWVWTSGVSAVDLIWFSLDPLFIWAVPLLTFAMVYTLTRREETAAWSAGALALAGLMTLDNIVHYPGYTAFGRLTVLQITTLRQMSLTLMLPLALMAGFHYLHTRRWRDLLALPLIGLALAILHPFQIMLWVISLALTVGLHLLAGRDRLIHWGPLWPPRPNALLPLALALALTLTLPLVQRLNRSGLGAADSVVRESALEEAETVTTSGEFLLLPDAPLVGATYIRNPQTVFYHPLIALALLLGLLHGLALRRSLTAQYVFGTSLFFLLISFTPGLTEIFNKFASSVGLLTTLFIVPVALIFGSSLDALLSALPLRLRAYSRWPVSLLLIGGLALLLFEPLPLPASARDQLQSFMDMQQHRRLRPAQTALIDRLAALLPADQTSILMAPPDMTSLIIEDLPRTLVTGGRGSSNQARAGDNRFFNLFDSQAPWLDSADLDYMREWGVTHVILRADDTRLPQMLVQPERFALLEQTTGFVIFALNAPPAPDPLDDLFAQMNAQYAQTPQPRWGAAGFALARPGSPEIWEPLAADWQQALAAQPDSRRAQLGLAYAYLMQGADDQALPLWADLHNALPTSSPVTDALAYTHAALNQADQGAAALLAALDSPTPEARALAARTLLTETFFHLLDAERLDRVLTAAAGPVWEYLAWFDQPNRVRQQAALLLAAGRWDAAVQFLDQIDTIFVSPRDLTAQAAARLAAGDLDGALERLRPALDPAWRAAKAYRQPDRWQRNLAESLYWLLQGALDEQAGRLDAAIRAYEQAVTADNGLAGRYFLARALEQAGQPDRAAAVRAELAAAWNQPTPFPELDSLLRVLASGNPFVTQPVVAQEDSARTLTLTALYGSPQPHIGYPVQFWRLEVIRPDAGVIYAAQDAPAVWVENALARAAITLSLPDDLEPLTPALVSLKPAHNNQVTMPPALLPVTLNRPESAAVPADAAPVGLRFGESITLDSYTLTARPDALELTLYWQASAPPPEPYQVFVHVVDSAGTIIAQDDGAPVGGRYPTDQWRAGVVIADARRIALDNPPESFGVRVGLYRLPDGARLPVSPADARVEADSVWLRNSP
jgi:tetratricopeptide (TPR) repeat protein